MLAIGQTVWVYNPGRHFSEQERAQTTQAERLRLCFEPHKVVGETRVSWLIDDGRWRREPLKIDKKTLKQRGDRETVYTSEEEIRKRIWLSTSREQVLRQIERADRLDFALWDALARLVGVPTL